MRLVPPCLARLVWCAVLAVACAAAPASAAGAPARGGVLHVAIAAEPTTLDWMTTTAYGCREIAWNFFEPLYTLDRNYRIVPMLADGLPSVTPDGRIVTMKLRSGVRFHDGSTLVARDVVASMNRWGRLTAAGKAAFRFIDAVEPTDSQTIRIRLNAPFAPLVADMADVSSALFVIPANIADAAGTKPLRNDQLIGTGPFRFDSWQPGRVVRIKRFDDYIARNDRTGGLGGLKIAYLDEIDFELVKDPQVRLSGLQTGQYQYVQALSEDALDQVKRSPGVAADVIDPYAWAALVPNKAAGPLTNVKLRAAISLAIDRPQAARGAFGPDTFWYLDGSIFFPAQRGLYSAAGTQAYRMHDPERARRLVREAHYDGTPIVYLTTKDYAWMYNIAQVVVPQLEAIGLKVDLQTYDWPTILSKRNAPSGWDLFATGFNIALDPAAMIWMNPHWAGAYQSPRMDGLLRDWAHATSPSDKARVVERIQQTVYDEYPVVKLGDYKQLNAYGAALHGYSPYMDFTFWNTWLSPA